MRCATQVQGHGNNPGSQRREDVFVVTKLRQRPLRAPPRSAKRDGASLGTAFLSVVTRPRGATQKPGQIRPDRLPGFCDAGDVVVILLKCCFFEQNQRQSPIAKTRRFFPESMQRTPKLMRRE